MKRNILFYFPSNIRAVSIESLAIAFRNQGHNVYFLSQYPFGPIHQVLEPKGIRCICYPIEKGNPVLFYLKHAIKLIRVVREHKIDVVFSNVQVANFPAAIAQYFCKARIVIGRHHTDTGIINQIKNEVRIDKLINALGKEFIVPGNQVYDAMISEGVSPEKIRLIRYGYDFSEYGKPDPATVESIRKSNQAKMLIVKAARFFPEKRHLVLLKVIHKLNKEGMDIKCLLLSDGPYRSAIEDFIKDHNMSDTVQLTGFRNDILNYLAAGDLIVHLSSSEASNNLIKEAGLIRKPVVVCKNVGDFDEYLVDHKNAFLLNKEDPEPELEKLIRSFYSDASFRKSAESVGNQLHDDVINTFSIEKVIGDYEYYLQ